jgi:hypothetical protein
MKKMSLEYLLLLIIIGCSFLVIPNVGAAGVNLPWSSTYNCSDWTNFNQTLNCDGITPWGNFACTPQNYTEQILPSANNLSGGGGSGIRHWIGDGNDINSGGTYISFNSPQTEIWVRWYNRWQSGFRWGSYGGYKVLYFYDQNGTSVAIQLFFGANQSQFWLLHNSSQVLWFSNNAGWDNVYANGAIDPSTGYHLSDGTWHSYEIHLKRETSAGNNGVAQLWMDGVLKGTFSNVNFNMYGSGLSWTGFIVGSNTKSSSNGGCAYVDYDDIAISNTGYIGPLVNGIAPLRPSSPTNLH